MSASMRDYLDRTFASGGPILWGGRHMKALPKEGSTTDWREKVTRRVFAVGRVTKDAVDVRRKCMSCRRWLEGEPEGEYRATHSICGDCASLHYELRY